MIRPYHTAMGLVWRRLIILGAVVVGSGCFLAGGPSAVSPDEIPDLEARLTQNPEDGELTLRYAAALFAADRCSDAVPAGQRGRQIRPSDAIGPLVIGQCWEQEGRFDDALSLYRTFSVDHPEARGVSAVQARELIVRRARATTVARQAIQNEASLTGQAPASAVAILPLTISGDSSYQPLGRGLAQMLISDLAVLQQFQLVERLELRALLDELQLAETERVDANTAARVGRLVRAGRMVSGLLVIPRDGDIRLEGSVVQANSQVAGSSSHTGRFRELLRLEKQLVIGIAEQLGYRLSEAERAMVLENGTQNLAAFLAYSDGLVAEELGDYAAAAQHFGVAVRSDPSFGDARSRHRTNSAAPAVQQASASQVTTVANSEVADPTSFPEPVSSAVASGIGDLAPTRAEQTTESTSSAQQGGGEHVTRQSSSTTISSPPPPDATPPATVTATIRIIFRIP